VSHASWCKQQGGTAQTQYPYRVDPATQKLVRLGGEREMCTFTAADGSRIAIAADVLASDKVTLAQSAYLGKTPDPGGGVGNPSIAYCHAINGTAMYGPGKLDAGGWGPAGATKSDQVISACMFGDGSVIDAWGLKYHTGGVIRGADLAKKFRAQGS
jgi:putative hemolysin